MVCLADLQQDIQKTIRQSKRRLVAIALMALSVESSRAQTSIGVWEGEIQNPERPIIALIDFDAGVASFSGGPPLPITKRDISDGQVTFEITSGARVLKFYGRRRQRPDRRDAESG